MDKLLLQFLLMVSVGALIGWFTNYLAIKLLFRPYKEMNFIFFKIQGLIPKRKNEIIENIADTVEKELISLDDIIGKFKNSDIDSEMLDSLLNKIIGNNLKATIIEKFPIAQMFINDSLMEKIQSYIKDAIVKNKDEIIEEIIKLAEKNIDFKEIMLEKMENFSLKEIEDIILRVSKQELKHIEIIGGVLGGIIAVFQFGVMFLLNQI